MDGSDSGSPSRPPRVVRHWNGAPWPRTAGASIKLYYGWVIVGAGMLITCVGFGTTMSLGVFLEPMTTATNWSRTGVSTAATVTFLAMGVASFFWGWMFDRFGARVVV